METLSEKSEVEYWESQFKKAQWQKNGDLVIRDNWEKRVKMMHFMTKYDWYGTKILEIGTGFAAIAGTLRLICGGFQYEGTDMSKSWAELASKLFKLKVRQAKANALPFDDNSFNRLLLFDTLEHINPTEREDSYGEMRRVMKDKFMIFINNPYHGNNSLHMADREFFFKDKDVARFAESMDAEIKEVMPYTANKYFNDGSTRENKYQFIVIGKE